MLFLMVNLKERTQNTVLHTVNTAVLGSCGGGAILYGRTYVGAGPGADR